MSRVFLSLIMVLTLVSASFASIFQGQSQQPQPQDPSGQSAPAQSMPNAGSRQPQPGRQAGTDVSMDDKRFVYVASESSMAEVAHAQLALQRAASDEVKQFAQRMIDDQKKSSQELIRLAMNKGVRVSLGQSAPSPLTGKYRSVNDRLATLSGEEFDREYIRNQVKMR